MRLIIAASEATKGELISQGTREGHQIEWVSSAADFKSHTEAEVYMDLEFDNNSGGKEIINSLSPATVIVSSVIETLDQLPFVAARMNGWPTFLQRSLVEATARDEQSKLIVSNAFDIFNKKISWTQDLPGFISARIIAMIINEAYFTLAEKVSTKKEIDLALKLGTNYPYGPFEWAKQIGMEKISRLLEVLESEDERYRPAPFIKRETI